MGENEKKNKRNVTGAGLLLWKSSNVWQRVLRDKLKSIGITHVQLLLLETVSALEAEGKKPTQIMIARVADIDVMMTSKVLRTLEKQQLISRKSAKDDARSVNLQLTPGGKRKLISASRIYTTTEQEFFSRLVSKPHKFLMNLEALNGVDSQE